MKKTLTMALIAILLVILTDGKVDLGKLQPIVFDAASMSYRSVGDIVGKAWGDGTKFQ